MTRRSPLARRAVRVILFIAAAPALVAACAGPITTRPITTTRFQFDPSDRIPVVVRIEGRAHPFVFDVGTRHTTVTSAVATTVNRPIRESRPGVRTIELGGITSTGIVAAARLPREPERTGLVLADGVVSARALTASWIVFDTPRSRIILGP